MMKINLDDAIKTSKNIIWYGNNNNNIFQKYDRAFFDTTECIKEYLAKVEFKKDRALSVLSSGDHIFNLIYEGVREIDAFDVNYLQYFVYYLKRALVLELSFKEYKQVYAMLFDYDEKVAMKLLDRVKPNLDDKVYEYFEEILEFCKRVNKPFSNLFCLAHSRSFMANNYLASERDYLVLKDKIKDAKVNLDFCDVSKEILNFRSGYDVILLSNIADYLNYSMDTFGIKQFREYIEKFRKLLNRGGVIINYLYNVDLEVVIDSKGVDKDCLITLDNLGREYVRELETYPYNTTHDGYYLVRER